MPNGRTGLWTPTYATREEAQRLIRERQEETGLDYLVEEVVPDNSLAASRQGPSKASEAPGDGGDSGEGVGTP